VLISLHSGVGLSGTKINTGNKMNTKTHGF
jgi:hypothetical protein